MLGVVWPPKIIINTSINKRAAYLSIVAYLQAILVSLMICQRILRLVKGKKLLQGSEKAGANSVNVSVRLKARQDEVEELQSRLQAFLKAGEEERRIYEVKDREGCALRGCESSQAARDWEMSSFWYLIIRANW